MGWYLLGFDESPAEGVCPSVAALQLKVTRSPDTDAESPAGAAGGVFATAPSLR